MLVYQRVYIHLVHWNCTSKAVWKSIPTFEMCPGTGLGSQEAETHLTSAAERTIKLHMFKGTSEGDMKKPWILHDFTSQVRGVDGLVNDMSVIASNPSRIVVFTEKFLGWTSWQVAWLTIPSALGAS